MRTLLKIGDLQVRAPGRAEGRRDVPPRRHALRAAGAAEGHRGLQADPSSTPTSSLYGRVADLHIKLRAHERRAPRRWNPRPAPRPLGRPGGALQHLPPDPPCSTGRTSRPASASGSLAARWGAATRRRWSSRRRARRSTRAGARRRVGARRRAARLPPAQQPRRAPAPRGYLERKRRAARAAEDPGLLQLSPRDVGHARPARAGLPRPRPAPKTISVLRRWRASTAPRAAAGAQRGLPARARLGPTDPEGAREALRGGSAPGVKRPQSVPPPAPIEPAPPRRPRGGVVDARDRSRRGGARRRARGGA